MPDRSHKHRPRDLNSLVAVVIGEATGEVEAEADNGKDLAAVALGRMGGLKGGKARAVKLTPEQRSAASR